MHQELVRTEPTSELRWPGDRDVKQSAEVVPRRIVGLTLWNEHGANPFRLRPKVLSVSEHLSEAQAELALFVDRGEALDLRDEDSRIVFPSEVVAGARARCDLLASAPVGRLGYLAIAVELCRLAGAFEDGVPPADASMQPVLGLTKPQGRGP